jgi:hypothetical protein
MIILQRFLNFVGKVSLISALTVIGSSLVFAQTPPPAATAAKKEPRKQTLTFEDELVEGSTQKPELFYLFQKKNFNYKRLIKLRDNFLPEMKRSTEDIQRGRSNN